MHLTDAPGSNCGGWTGLEDDGCGFDRSRRANERRRDAGYDDGNLRTTSN